MDRIFALFCILALLSISAISSEAEKLIVGSDAEPLIRQVVDGDGQLRLGTENHFSLFKRRFGKSYGGSQEEHDYRFNVFRANLHRARRHRSLYPSAVHGVTQFWNKVLGLRGLRLPADANKAPILPTDDLPSDFDWRDQGAVTPVKNQVCTRLDITFVVEMLRRYQSNPGINHWRAMKKVMRYLKDTKNYMLMYR